MSQSSSKAGAALHFAPALQNHCDRGAAQGLACQQLCSSAGNMTTAWRGQGPVSPDFDPLREEPRGSYLHGAVRAIRATPAALAAPLGGGAAAAR